MALPSPGPLDPEALVRLVVAARSGDREAFARLVEGHARMVYVVALSVLRDPDSAADAAQNAWMEARAALGRLRDPARFPAWVARIARYRALSLRAAERRHLSLLSRFGRGLLGRPGAAAAAGGGGGEEDGDGEWVWRAVGDLPERYRELFLLRHLDGRDYDEIARITGLSAKGVASRIRRARMMLIDWWERKGGGR